MKKILEIILWTLAFFAIYFPTSYAIDWYFSSKINLVAMMAIGIIFALILVVCLVFELPEKINYCVKEEESEKKEEVEEFFEKNQNCGGENEKQQEQIVQSIH